MEKTVTLADIAQSLDVADDIDDVEMDHGVPAIEQGAFFAAIVAEIVSVANETFDASFAGSFGNAAAGGFEILVNDVDQEKARHTERGDLGLIHHLLGDRAASAGEVANRAVPGLSAILQQERHDVLLDLSMRVHGAHFMISRGLIPVTCACGFRHLVPCSLPHARTLPNYERRPTLSAPTKWSRRKVHD